MRKKKFARQLPKSLCASFQKVECASKKKLGASFQKVECAPKKKVARQLPKS